MSAEAVICGELEETAKPAVLQNFSEGGFGLLTPEPRYVGQRIRVRVSNADGASIEIPTRVKWQLSSNDGYYCGCSFLKRQSYNDLSELFKASEQTAQQEPQRLLPPAPCSPWVAAGAFAGLVVPSLLVIFADRPLPDPADLMSPALEQDIEEARPAADEPTVDLDEPDGKTAPQPTHEPPADAGDEGSGPSQA